MSIVIISTAIIFPGLIYLSYYGMNEGLRMMNEALSLPAWLHFLVRRQG